MCHKGKMLASLTLSRFSQIEHFYHSFDLIVCVCVCVCLCVLCCVFWVCKFGCVFMLFYYPYVSKHFNSLIAYYCILHQIAFRQGAAILDAIRQGQPFCMAQQKMYSPQKWAHSIVMLGTKLRSTCSVKISQSLLQFSRKGLGYFCPQWLIVIEGCMIPPCHPHGKSAPLTVYMSM